MRFTTALVAIASIFATVSVAAPSPETISNELKCGVCDFNCQAKGQCFSQCDAASNFECICDASKQPPCGELL